MKFRLKKVFTLLLAVLLVVQTIAPTAFSVKGATSSELDVKKTIDWDPVNDRTHANVTISSNIPKPEKETQVLFLGTLCGAHSMQAGTATDNTITESLYAIANNADVQYYLLNEDPDNAYVANPTAAQMYSGTKNKISRGTTTGVTASIKGSGNHDSYCSFINVLYSELCENTNTTYDYLVLEFDSSRVAKNIDPSKFSTNFINKVNAVAAKLAEMYANEQVIWITDGYNQNTSNKQYGVIPYTPTNKLYYSSDGTVMYLTAEKFRYLCALVAPSYYNENTTVNSDKYGDGKNEKKLDSFTLKLGQRIVVDDLYGELDSSTGKYMAYSEDSRQMYYKDAEELADFLYMAIKPVTMKLEDKIHVSDDNSIKITKVSYYLTKSTNFDSATWYLRKTLDVKGSTPEEGKTTVSVGDDVIVVDTKTNDISITMHDVRSDITFFKCVIELEDPNGFSYCTYLVVDKDGKPILKDGHYQYVMNPNDGEAKVSAYIGDSSVATATGAAAAAAVDAPKKKVVSTVKNGDQDYPALDGARKQQGELEGTDSPITVTTYEGDKVVLNYAPDNGFVLDEIKVDGAKITLTSGAYEDKTNKFNVTSDADGKVQIIFSDITEDHTADVVYKSGVTATKTVVTPVAESGKSPVVKGGDSITYKITLTNIAGTKATGITLSDVIDTTLVTYESSNPAGTYDATTKTVTWSDVEVPAKSGSTNGTKEITLTVKAIDTLTKDSGKVKNTVTAKHNNNELPPAEAPEIDPKGKDLTVVYNVPTENAPSTFTKPEDDTTPYGEPYEEEEVTPVGGFTFLGWYTDSDLKKEYDNSKPLNDTNFTLTDNKLNLYGKWEYNVSMVKEITSKKTGLLGGDTVSYKITVTNTSATAATGVTVTDELNTNLIYVDKSASNSGAYDSKTKTLTWSNLTIPAKSGSTAGKLELTFSVTIDPYLSATTEIPNIAKGKQDNQEFQSPSNDDNKINPDPKTFDVTYVYVGDEVPADAKKAADRAEEKLVYGTEYESQTDTDVSGYIFDGWYTDKECTKKYVEKTELKEDLTLYGKYVYGVSLDKTVSPEKDVRGGDKVTYSIDVVNDTDEKVTGVKVTDELDTDKVIYVVGSASNSGTYASGTVTWENIEVAANSKVTLTFDVEIKSTITTQNTKIENQAEGELQGKNGKKTFKSEKNELTVNPKLLTVEYEYVGTAPEGATPVADLKNTSVEYGSAYNSATKPEVSAYIFKGWYTDQACETLYTDGTTLTENKKLYGKFEYGLTIEKSVDPATDLRGGDEVTYTIVVKNATAKEVTGIDVSDELNENLTYVKDSASDSGTYDEAKTTVKWTISVAANGEKSVTFKAKISETLTEETEIKNIAVAKHGKDPEIQSPEKPENTIKPGPKLLTVEYAYVGTAPEGATPVADLKDDDVEYGSAYNSATKPEVSAYIFKGWYTDQACETPYTDGTTLTENKTLYGKFEYGLTIEKSVSPATDLRGGDEVTYTIVVKNATAKEVTGIDVSDELNENLTYVKDSASDSGTYDEAKTTVKWTVSVAANGEKSVTFKATISETLKEETEIKNIAVAKHGDDPEIQSPEKPENTIEPGPKLLKVSYEYAEEAPEGADDISANDEDDVPYGTNYNAATKPTLEGYTFDGWYTDAACESKDKYTDGTELTADMTLYGKFVYKMSLEKIVDDTTVTAGATATYTITVKNDSESDATEITVTDVLDDNLIYVEDSADNDGVYDEDTKTITWSDLSVEAGKTLDLKFKATVKSDLTEETEIENVAEAEHGDQKFKSVSNEDNKLEVDPQKFDVEYHIVGDSPNGATDPATLKEEDIDYGTEYTAADKLKLDGYTFSGWYTTDALTTLYTDETPLTDDLDLYGSWNSIKDFTITKTVKYNGEAITEAIAPGSTVSYSITVKNNNQYAAISDIVIEDPVPDGLTDVANINESGALDSGKITWTISLAAGAEKTLSFNATVPATLKVEKSYKNVATIASAEEDPVNKPAEVTFTAKPEDIVVSVSKVWSDTWDSHEDDEITVRLYANDVDTEKEIILTKDEPSWSGEVAPYDAEGTAITYVFKEVSAEDEDLDEGDMTGADDRYAVKYETNQNVTTITNNYVINASDFEFTKTAEELGKPGESFTYTITLKNTREYEDATDIVITDKLPEGLTLAEQDALEYAPDETVEEEDGELTWTIPELAAGKTATLKITVVIPEDADAEGYENVAKIEKVGPTSYEEQPVPSPKALTEVRIFSVKKVWTDTAQHDAISVQLLRNGQPYLEAQELSADNNWSYKWEKLPLYDSENVKYVYTVSELEIEGYNAAIEYTGSTDGNTSATITNSPKTFIVKVDMKGSVPKGAIIPEDELVKWGEKIDPTVEPQIKGYKFLGWYLDPECTLPYTFGDPINESNTVNGELQLYGLWEEEIVLTGDNNAPVYPWALLLVLALLGVGVSLMIRARKENN